MGRKATSKRKAHALSRRKVRRQENTYTDVPSRDKTIGKCTRRGYGVGIGSGVLA